jgi:glycosyltransferase involved in cell wall biosynthesis
MLLHELQHFIEWNAEIGCSQRVCVKQMRTSDPEIMTDGRDPKVSIIIPVYNGADFLREAIDSALAQTYPNIEIIVVNDGSDDGGITEQIALSYSTKISYYFKENGGVASALNYGIETMSGELFSWLSHDDVYYPEKVEAQIIELRKMLQPSVLYSNYELIDDRSQFLRKVTSQYYTPGEFRKALIIDNPIHGCSALVPRICFERVGLFDERLRTTQDYDLWFRLAKEYSFHQMPVVLLKSREHKRQGTVTLSSLHIRECNSFLISGMHELVAEKMAKRESKESIDLFLAECAISFKKRDFLKAARHAFKEFKKSSGWLKIVMNPDLFLVLLNYMKCGATSILNRMNRKLFQVYKNA